MKKILTITLILILMLVPLGCTKEDAVEESPIQEIKLNFTAIGMIASFDIDKSLGYDNFNLEAEEGLPPIATFDNLELGLDYRMSLITLNKDSYNELKAKHVNDSLFQELEYGDYNGFVFSVSDCYGEGYLILKEEDINLYALSLGVYTKDPALTGKEPTECIGFSQYSKDDLKEMLSNLKIEEYDLEEEKEDE